MGLDNCYFADYLSHADCAQGSGHDERHVKLTLSDKVTTSPTQYVSGWQVSTLSMVQQETFHVRFSQMTGGLLMHAYPFKKLIQTTLGSSLGAVSAPRVLLAITKRGKCPLHIGKMMALPCSSTESEIHGFWCCRKAQTIQFASNERWSHRHT